MELDSESNHDLQCSHPKHLYHTPAHNVTSLLIKANFSPLCSTVSCKSMSHPFAESSVRLFLSEPLAVKSDAEVNQRVNIPTPPFLSWTITGGGVSGDQNRLHCYGLCVPRVVKELDRTHQDLAPKTRFFLSPRPVCLFCVKTLPSVFVEILTQQQQHPTYTHARTRAEGS